MKSLARRNTHVKYESPSTYRSKVMTKDNVFEKNGKVKDMVSNERSYQKEYIWCEI
jgi:hypothetical protein